MYNRRVKFGLKIPNRLGKNARKRQGGFFLTHTVVQLFSFHLLALFVWDYIAEWIHYCVHI